jgi:aspartyl-tRNA(Asn)/glutamyl-tRNA(Gln) amidotransferase subunit A
MNVRMLRNTCIVNQFDGCALSIPCQQAGDPPAGLMLAGLPMQDDKILQIGLAVEEAIRGL